jgi:hypothetical protein
VLFYLKAETPVCSDLQVNTSATTTPQPQTSTKMSVLLGGFYLFNPTQQKIITLNRVNFIYDAHQ